MSVSYRVLIIDGNLLDGVCAPDIFVQETGNEITTSFHINIKLSPRRQQPEPTADMNWGPLGARCVWIQVKKGAAMGEETKLARK